MKRRLTAWLLCGLLLFLPGCGAEAESEESADLIQVGVVQLGAESDWRVANSESVRAVFTEEKGYELLFTDARQKQENQITAIRRLIQQQVDYIILMPLAETGWDSVLQEAREAGIPVILADRQIDVADESLFTAWLGSDFQGEGEMAVSWMEERFGDQPVNILHVQGTLDSSAQLGRTAALEAGARRNGNWEILTQIDGDFTRAKTYEGVKAYLREHHPEIQVAYCENDSEAFGVIQALEEEGYRLGGETGVQVIAFDATRTGLAACLEGKIALEVECDPLMGEPLEELIRRLEAGETPEKYTYLEERAFTKADLSERMIAERPY